MSEGEPPEWCSHIQCAFHTYPCWIYAREQFLTAYIRSLNSGAGAGDLLEDVGAIDEGQVVALARKGEYGEMGLPWDETVALAVCGADAEVFAIRETYDVTYVIASERIPGEEQKSPPGQKRF